MKRWTVIISLAAALGCGANEPSTAKYQDCRQDADCGDGPICRNQRCTEACAKRTTEPDPGCPKSQRGFPVWCTDHGEELWCEEILL